MVVDLALLRQLLRFLVLRQHAAARSAPRRLARIRRVLRLHCLLRFIGRRRIGRFRSRLLRLHGQMLLFRRIALLLLIGRVLEIGPIRKRSLWIGSRRRLVRVRRRWTQLALRRRRTVSRRWILNSRRRAYSAWDRCRAIVVVGRIASRQCERCADNSHCDQRPVHLSYCWKHCDSVTLSQRRRLQERRPADLFVGACPTTAPTRRATLIRSALPASQPPPRP